jgi:predicted ester cyclase
MIPALFHADFCHNFGFSGLSDRLDSFVAVGQSFLAAFPDVHVELEALVAEGPWVAEINRVSAHHRGTWRGISPTGKHLSWSELHLYRLQGGKIIENWPFVNFEHIYAQLSS